MQIVVNPFCKKRHTPESEYSHFDGSWDELVRLVQDHFDGSREGVVVLDVPADGFFSGVIKLSESSVLEAVFVARREGEDPYVHIRTIGVDKTPAKSVQVVLYSHETLAETGDNCSEADWEIISINAWATAKTSYREKSRESLKK